MSHLGGHANVTHTDAGVLDFLRSKFEIATMYDIGCGPGGMEEVAAERGIDWRGVDGDPAVAKPKTHIHDFTKGPVKSVPTVDLVWSIEFLEHVEEKYQDNYMQCFKAAPLVFCTAAPPGKPGHHHVNCRTQAYWIKVFEKYGFVFDPELTQQCRAASTMRREFVRTMGMAFRRK